ncbi:hypothetical protein OPKNFCMD_4775 [Methylobacterium crusticola]|uniref:Blue-light-activated histidine kinase n=1 Tax=Methylobacterium crusticola TaxID=1697972 RepID=A0ABQ4R2W6_9HYPH|nr:HWE histidine kinase domain-containing protein [Methylobacterium crusticola]GJD52013.1 hypothetical protein OPKNFCMD_4775 [Methylobacterium crusticola]
MTDEIPSRAELEAENRRLRALLEQAGIGAEHRAARAPAGVAANPEAGRGREGLLPPGSGPAPGADGVAGSREAAALEAGRAALRASEAALAASRASLAASEERLALVFAASNTLGWWDWDIQADRVYANDTFIHLYGLDPSAARHGGLPVARFVEGIHPEDRERVGARIAEVVATAGEFAEEYRLLHRDGGTTWVHARGRSSHDAAGLPLRFPGISLDITARKREEALQAAQLALGDRLRDLTDAAEMAFATAETLGRTLGIDRAGYVTVDPLRETAHVARDWSAPGLASLAGACPLLGDGAVVAALKRGETVVVPGVDPGPRAAGRLDALGIRTLLALPLIERGRLVAFLFAAHGRDRAWSRAEVAFVRDAAARTRTAVARQRAEERQSLLNHELSHRLKNTLAVVQAIAAQTLRNAPSLEAARDSLATRLIALGKAHDILLAAGIRSAGVAALAAGALALHDDRQARIALAGPDLQIGPAAALSLALMLHELATNAVKYGALSVPEGRVSVRWAIEGEAAAARFTLTWREAGGPAVTPPLRRGFGSRLIERGLAGAVSGTVTLAFEPAGVVCTLAAPLADMQGEPGA